jgi:hypothetical protein
MSEPSFDDVLNRYAARKTAPDEELFLARAAMEDQSAFDALVKEEVLRQLLDEPASRKMLLKAAARPPRWRTVLERIMEPRMMWSLAGAVAAAALIVGLVLERPGAERAVKTGVSGGQTLSSMDPMPEDARKAFDSFTGVTRPNDSAASIRIEKKQYRLGDGLRLHFRCEIEARSMLIEESPDGKARILFPNPWTPEAQVRAGTDQSVPPAERGPIQLDGAPGRLRFILAAFPADSDPAGALQRGDPLPVPLAVATESAEVAPQ